MEVVNIKVLQVLGHNAVIVQRSDGKACVVTGPGIGFRKQKGDRIQANIVQKLYIEETENFVKKQLIKN